MIVARIVASVSILVWLFPPFRQYKNKFFIYFLILAILDPLVLLIQLFIYFQPVRIYLIGSLIQMISLMSSKNILRYKFILLPIIIINIWFSFYFGRSEIMAALIVEILIILTIFLRLTLTNIYENMHIKLFYIILDFYVISLIVKFLVSLVDLKLGMNYFFLVSAFEIIIGIFFIFFNDENSPKFNWGLKKGN